MHERIRKPIPPPDKPHKSEKDYNRKKEKAVVIPDDPVTHG